MKNNQSDILAQLYSINQIKKWSENLSSTIEQAEERISEFDYSFFFFSMTQSE